MTFKDTLRFSLKTLCLAPLRSSLTVLGLAIGIGAILTVLTLGSAGQAQVETEINRMGVNKIWITAAHDSPYALTRDDANLITACTGVSASGRAALLTPVALEGVCAYAQLTGLDPQAQSVYPIHLLQGRFLTPLDHQQCQTIALVDESLCQALALSPAQALGMKLNLTGKLYRIVGVISDQAVQTVGLCQGNVYIPLSCFEQTYGEGVDEITLNIPSDAQAQPLTQTALSALNPHGHYLATTLEDEIAAARSVIRIFVMVLACVAGVCMLVGGIGVMNILLVSVRERRREIGILKALGATRRQICWFFLTEAVLYSLGGALAGLVTGLVMIDWAGRWIGLSAILKPLTLITTLLAAGLLGICFGVVPALRAARLMPVEALNAP